MNHTHNEQLKNAQGKAEWLQATQNMVGGTIATYFAMMKQIAPQQGDRLIFWLGARTNMVFGMGFDMSVNKEGVLQAFVSNTGGTVAQIAAGKVGGVYRQKSTVITRGRRASPRNRHSCRGLRCCLYGISSRQRGERLD